MSRRSGQSAATVSLFPFLAVLVCAMGSLILLLLVITRHVRPDPVRPTPAVAVEESPTGESIPLLPLAIASDEEPVTTVPGADEAPLSAEPAATAVATMATTELIETEDEPEPLPVYPAARPFDPLRDGDTVAYRKQQEQLQKIAAAERMQAELAERSRQLSAALREAEASYQQMQRAQREAQTGAGELSEQTRSVQQSIERQKQELASVQQEISRRKLDLQQLQAEQENRQNKLEIVAYQGRSGAQRQPIFIECRVGEIVFHPENVAISTEELEKIPAEISPLTLAVEALNEYRVNRSGEPIEPYVLIVGRPNGIKEFYGCGHILGANGIPFGYELLDQDRELYLGKADPAAREVIQRAISEALQQSIAPRSRFAEMHRQAQQRSAIPSRGTPEGSELAGGMPLPPPAHHSLLPQRAGSPPSSPNRESSAAMPRQPATDSQSLQNRIGSQGAWSTTTVAPDSRSAPASSGSTAPPFPDAAPPSFTRTPPPPQSLSQQSQSLPTQSQQLQSPQSQLSQMQQSQLQQSLAQLQQSQTQPPPSQSGASPPGAFQSQASPNRSATDASSAPPAPDGLAAFVPPPPSPQMTKSGGPPQTPGMVPLQVGPTGSGPAPGAISVTRAIEIEVYAEGLQVGSQKFIRGLSDMTPDRQQNEVLQQLRVEVSGWDAPPEGIQWKPVVYMKVAPGGNLLAYRVEQLAQQLNLEVKSQPILQRSPGQTGSIFD